MKDNVKSKLLLLVPAAISLVVISAVFYVTMLLQVFNNAVDAILSDFVWTIVYFVLPIIAFLLPIVLSLALKTDIKRACLLTLASVLVYVVISVGIYISANAYFKSFTPQKWMEYEDQRWLMLEDMAEETDFRGMTREEVVEILGEPTTPYAAPESEDEIEYFVGSLSIYPTMLTFVFEDGRVCEIYEYTESRSNGESLY